MRKYVITFRTVATTSVEVGANTTDEAIDIAIDLLDEEDVELGEWEVEDVSEEPIDRGYDD
jgi:hypothetical protein